ncbi:MAG: alpha/beta hydrolase [Candidatus Hydrogenedentes bacterium]|nr:alpha/beta hydrolase [Candidatus Hydrogenedentota bacterium]
MVLILFLLILLLLLVSYAFFIYYKVNENDIFPDEIYYVKTKDGWQIRLCRYTKDEKGIPILFVHGFGSNQNNFTRPHRFSMVDYLKNKNHDCWTMEMRYCKSSIPPYNKCHEDATIDDVLVYDLPAVINFILQKTGHNSLYWIGHSLGGMLLYAYLVHFGNDGKIMAGTTLGAPLGFRNVKPNISPVLVSKVKKRLSFYIFLLKLIVPFLKTFKINNPFFPVNPKNIHRALSSWDLCKMVEPPSGNMLETLANWYINNNWEMLNGELKPMENIEMINIPLQLFFAQSDPFVNIQTAYDFFDKLPNPSKEMFLLGRAQGFQHDYNHCDLAFGECCEKEVFEPINLWINKVSSLSTEEKTP